MPTIDDVKEKLALETGLAVISTTQADGRVLSSVANCGVVDHPITGPADIIGPDELPEGFDANDLRLLLRDIFQAAGGTHDDYDEYDRVLAAERRAAVLVTPSRILGSS